MSNAEEKARQISGMYYNQGLDLAGIRDLTGAVTKLKISLQFNKNNIQARNLLGLVYYETGEAVAALREWVISFNLQPVNNPAEGYINEIRKDKGRLEQLNATIQKYNEALRECREGNDDVAALQLRRVVNKNPKLVNAYLLLALIDIKAGRYTHAGRLLRKAAKIDRANPTIHRYLKEIDAQTGTTTTMDLTTKSNQDRKKGAAVDDAEMLDENLGAPSRKLGFRDSGRYSHMINVLLGMAFGILVTWLVIGPTVRSGVSREANEKLVEYTATMAAQESKIQEMQKKIDASNLSAEDAQAQLENKQNAADSYDNLLRAYTDYQNQYYERAGDEISKVDGSLLSTAASEIYNEIKDPILNEAYSIYKFNGDNAYYLENWAEAALQYEKALAINADDYDMITLLAQAYTNLHNKDKAIEVYQKIIDTYPNTRRSEYAVSMIEGLGGTAVLPDKNASSTVTDEDAGTDDTAADTGEDFTDLDGDGIPDDETVTEEYNSGDETVYDEDGNPIE